MTNCGSVCGERPNRQRTWSTETKPRYNLVQQVGASLEIYAWPVSRFGGGFVGTPAMNMLDGKLS